MECKICGKALDEGVEYMCVDCRDHTNTAAPMILNYIETYLPLPANTFNALSSPDEYDEYETRLISRSAAYLIADRMLEQPFDDPCDVVLDLAIELHSYSSSIESEDDSRRIDIYESVFNDIRRYLSSLGYTWESLSRY